MVGPAGNRKSRHEWSQEMAMKISAARLIWFAAAVIVGVALQLVACSSPQSEVLGKWESADKKVRVEFFEDKTLVLALSEKKKDTLTGKWVMLTDGRMKIDLTMGVFPLPPAMGSLAGGTLTLEGGLWEKEDRLVLGKVKK
jgi:hypothetical protein